MDRLSMTTNEGATKVDPLQIVFLRLQVGDLTNVVTEVM